MIRENRGLMLFDFSFRKILIGTMLVSKNNWDRLVELVNGIHFNMNRGNQQQIETKSNEEFVLKGRYHGNK